jgi:hypothetical protein
MIRLAPSATITRPIRQDPWEHIGRATVRLVYEQYSRGDAIAARQLLDYAEREYRTVREIYASWNFEMVCYLEDHVENATLERIFQFSLQPWVHLLLGESEPLRLSVRESEALLARSSGEVVLRVVPALQRRYLLAFPGKPLEDPSLEFRRKILANIEHQVEPFALLSLLGDYVDFSRVLHDIYADWAWALLSLGLRQFGEDKMEAMLRATMEPWVSARYQRSDEMGMVEQAWLAIEGMRGHFCGPERQGDVEVLEEQDRWILSFDPCGSGGRMRRGDPLNNTPSRYDSPFNFLDVRGPHPWTWGKAGVCLYCAHCALVNEILPIERIGYPIRVTEYPVRPEDKCRWIIYKHPDLVPEEAYRRIGREKPRSSSP